MSWVWDKVTDAADDVWDFIDDEVFDPILNYYSWVNDKVFKPIVKYVEAQVQSFIDNPIETIAKIAIVMAPIPPSMKVKLYAMVDATSALANGEGIDGALKAYAISYASGQIAEGVSDYAGSAAWEELGAAGISDGTRRLVTSAITEGTRAATTAVIYGEDPMEAFLTGGVGAFVQAGLGKVGQQLEGQGIDLSSLQDKYPQITDALAAGLESSLSQIIVNGEIDELKLARAITAQVITAESVNNLLEDIGFEDLIPTTVDDPNTSIDESTLPNLRSRTLTAITGTIQNTVSAVLSGGSGSTAFGQSVAAYTANAIKSSLTEGGFQGLLDDTAELFDRVSGSYTNVRVAAESINENVLANASAVEEYNELATTIGEEANELKRLDDAKLAAEQARAKILGDPFDPNNLTRLGISQGEQTALLEDLTIASTEATNAYNTALDVFKNNVETVYNPRLVELNDTINETTTAIGQPARTVTVNTQYGPVEQKQPATGLYAEYANALGGLTSSTEDLDKELQPLYRNINEGVVSELTDGGFNAEEYAAVNKLPEGTDAYEHYLQQGVRNRLPINQNQYDDRFLSQSNNIVLGILKEQGINPFSLSSQEWADAIGSVQGQVSDLVSSLSNEAYQAISGSLANTLPSANEVNARGVSPSVMEDVTSMAMAMGYTFAEVVSGVVPIQYGVNGEIGISSPTYTPMPEYGGTSVRVSVDKDGNTVAIDKDGNVVNPVPNPELEAELANASDANVFNDLVAEFKEQVPPVDELLNPFKDNITNLLSSVDPGQLVKDIANSDNEDYYGSEVVNAAKDMVTAAGNYGDANLSSLSPEDQVKEWKLANPRPETLPPRYVEPTDKLILDRIAKDKDTSDSLLTTAGRALEAGGGFVETVSHIATWAGMSPTDNAGVNLGSLLVNLGENTGSASYLEEVKALDEYISNYQYEEAEYPSIKELGRVITPDELTPEHRAQFDRMTGTKGPDGLTKGQRAFLRQRMTPPSLLGEELVKMYKSYDKYPVAFLGQNLVVEGFQELAPILVGGIAGAVTKGGLKGLLSYGDEAASAIAFHTGLTFAAGTDITEAWGGGASQGYSSAIAAQEKIARERIENSIEYKMAVELGDPSFAKLIYDIAFDKGRIARENYAHKMSFNAGNLSMILASASMLTGGLAADKVVLDAITDPYIRRTLTGMSESIGKGELAIKRLADGGYTLVSTTGAEAASEGGEEWGLQNYISSTLHVEVDPSIDVGRENAQAAAQGIVIGGGVAGGSVTGAMFTNMNGELYNLVYDSMANQSGTKELSSLLGTMGVSTSAANDILDNVDDDNYINSNEARAVFDDLGYNATNSELNDVTGTVADVATRVGVDNSLSFEDAVAQYVDPRQITQ